MKMKTYPLSVQHPINGSCVQPVISEDFYPQQNDFKKEYAQSLTSLSTEQDVMHAPLEKSEGHIPDTLGAMGSMA